MSQIEFYKSFLFMVELIVAESIFLIRLKGNSMTYLRALVAIIACFIFSFLFPVFNNGPFYLCFMFICLFTFTVCAAKFVFKGSWFKILFCCIAGYTLQHLAYHCNNIFSLIIQKNSGGDLFGMYGMNLSPLFPNSFILTVYCFIFISIYACSYYIFACRINSQTFSIPSYMCVFMAFAILIVDVVLNAMALSWITENIGLILVGVHNIVGCIFALLLQFQLFSSWSLRSSLRIEKVARRFERERYVAVKDAMETINIKYHDLKFQAMNKNNVQLGEKTITDAETQTAIADYDSYTYTGNTALDVVLSETNRLCNKNNIKISYMTNGTLLSFMKDEDIYSLFGNLLNNSIEALVKCPQERRVMCVRILDNCKNMVSITVYNYCGKENQVYGSSLPSTTKKHIEMHGFGLKSVKRICEKYSGNMDIYIEEGFFNVNIIIPFAEK